MTCRTCGTCVLAEKHSRAHTSLQWLRPMADACHEAAARRTRPADGPLPSCPRLSTSVHEAWLRGELEATPRVVPPLAWNRSTDSYSQEDR